MKKVAFAVLAGSVLLLSQAAFAEEKAVAPAKEPAKEQTSSTQPASGRRFDNLSPEEQAKLKQQWQNMSAEEKAKVGDKAGDRAGDTPHVTQGQGRREMMVTDMTRLQQQYRASLTDLQAIRELAIKENAKETADALTKLIARYEMQFNQQMQMLQRRIRTTQRDQQAKTDKEAKPEEKAQTVSPKKEEPKPQGTENKPR
jgi:hypothetical protein